MKILLTILILLIPTLFSCGKKKDVDEGFHREARAAIEFDGIQSITAYAPLKYELTWQNPKTHLGDLTYKIYLQEIEPGFTMTNAQELPDAEERPVKRFDTDGSSLTLGEWKLVGTVEKSRVYRHEEKLPLDKAFLFKVTATDSDKIEDENSILGYLGEDPVLQRDYEGCLSAEAVSESEIKVTFEFPNGMDSLEIFRGDQAIATILSGEGDLSYIETNLQEGQDFEYRCVMKRRNIAKDGTKVIKVKTLSSPPVPGKSGEITFDIINTRTVEVKWNIASDVGTPQDLLTYQVYKSENKADLETVETTLLQGDPVGTLLQNSLTMISKGLSPSTTYYFNVVVTDKAGNSAIYEPTVIATPGDVVAPIPGNSGVIVVDSSDIGDTFITLAWERATDDVTKQILLTYEGYSSKTPITNITDLSPSMSAGEPDVDLTSFTIAGLETDTVYYYAVVVRDLSGNEAMYDAGNVKTKKDFTAPVPGNSGE